MANQVAITNDMVIKCDVIKCCYIAIWFIMYALHVHIHVNTGALMHIYFGHMTIKIKMMHLKSSLNQTYIVT